LEADRKRIGKKLETHSRKYLKPSRELKRQRGILIGAGHHLAQYTSAWETATAGGNLPDIIGFELTDAISAQYALLVRIRDMVKMMLHRRSRGSLCTAYNTCPTNGAVWGCRC
jgi:hypothetical protein